MTRYLAAAVLTVALTSGCSGSSLDHDLPPAVPGSESKAGLAWWSRAAMDAYLRWNAWTEARSGFVAMFARDGHPVYATVAGYADITDQTPLTLDTRMRFASMTKPVTAVAAHILLEEGKLGLDDPVERYIPAMANARVATSHTRGADGAFPTEPADPIPTVRHLLMFSSGVGPGMTGPSDLARHWKEHGLRSTRTGSLAERVDRIAQLPLFEQPATRWRYGGSADVLARVIEVAAGEPFGEFVVRRILRPLGMSSTSFLPAEAGRSELARVYTQNEAGDLVLAEPGVDAEDWTPGGSGLVSTAPDYMRFALMLWNRGEYDGTRILAEETVSEMTRLHVPSGVLAAQELDGEGLEGLGWGLGLSVVADSESTPFSDRDGDFWWGGYYGTTFFVSPESGLVGVILSQNQPGPRSDLPIALYVAQALAFAGL
ncbi:MAG: beta-lactamase family protein [Deltaproteobacteria bacterium]|nr:beta-lactamase family protein [Deltaproteobacteria bacterium]MBW2393309.1 beta-lactamase family protein [Deltaproteobacteria bacterium]